MSELLIVILVDKNYADYAELFTWCAKKSYSNYDVKVLHKEEIFPDHPARGYTTNSLRMVIPPKYVEGWKYIYITDADILILHSNPELLEFHVADMGDQCFSNSVRGMSNVFSFGNETWNGSQCLSGLHFCNQEWFSHVEPIAVNYREILKTAEVGRGYDGRILYLMCKELGFKIPEKKKLIKRHHGIHIGTFRLWDEGKVWINRPDAKPMTKEKADLSIRKRVDDWKIQRWIEMIRDPEYSAIIGRMTNPEVIGYVKKLEAYCNGECKK